MAVLIALYSKCSAVGYVSKNAFRLVSHILYKVSSSSFESLIATLSSLSVVSSLKKV